MDRHPVTITPTDNGPLKVEGDFAIVLPSGQPLITQRVMWLCRCGASQDKPFCDGSHKRIGFRATEADVRPERQRAAAAQPRVA